MLPADFIIVLSIATKPLGFTFTEVMIQVLRACLGFYGYQKEIICKLIYGCHDVHSSVDFHWYLLSTIRPHLLL